MFSLFIPTVVSPAEVLFKFKLQLCKASLFVVTGSDYNFLKLGNESFVELEHSTVAHKGLPWVSEDIFFLSVSIRKKYPLEPRVIRVMQSIIFLISREYKSSRLITRDLEL